MSASVPAPAPAPAPHTQAQRRGTFWFRSGEPFSLWCGQLCRRRHRNRRAAAGGASLRHERMAVAVSFAQALHPPQLRSAELLQKSWTLRAPIRPQNPRDGCPEAKRVTSSPPVCTPPLSSSVCPTRSTNWHRTGCKQGLVAKGEWQAKNLSITTPHSQVHVPCLRVVSRLLGVFVAVWPSRFVKVCSTDSARNHRGRSPLGFRVSVTWVTFSAHGVAVSLLPTTPSSRDQAHLSRASATHTRDLHAPRSSSGT